MKIIQPRLNYSLSIKEFFIYLLGFKFISDKELPTNYFRNSENIYFFDNARSGLQLFLELLAPNSRVGVQPLTCHTVLEAIENADCKVVFIDINEQLLIDKVTLKERIRDIDVLILTHTFGMMADVKEIKTLLDAKVLIEDCAHAFMSENKGVTAGEIADVSIYSFGFAKFPSAIKGGYLRLNNTKFLQRFSQEYKNVLEPTLKLKLKNSLYSILMPFLNNSVIYTFISCKIKEKRQANYIYSKPKVKATIYSCFKSNKAVFQSQLKSIDNKLSIQRTNGCEILNALSKNKKFKICQNSEKQNFFMIPVRLENSEDFIAYAKHSGIEIGRHFYSSKFFIEQYGYEGGSCPNYEGIIEQFVTIPSHYNYPIKRKLQLIKLIEAY